MADFRIIPASGTLSVTGSATMIGSGSTSNTSIFSVNGNNGRLFEVTDDLSTSIFSANTIAGLPVIEAFADNSVGLGRYGVSGSAIQINSSGSLLVNTGGYSTFGLSNRGVLELGGSTAILGLQINGTNAGYVYHGGSSLSLYNYLTGGITISNSGTGVQLTNGATSWTTYSDERLKTDLIPITNASDKVSQLRAVTGRYKTDVEDTRRSFLIAQDVQKVFPEALDIADDELKTLGIRYTEIIPLLVAAIQELKAEIEILKNK